MSQATQRPIANEIDPRSLVPAERHKMMIMAQSDDVQTEVLNALHWDLAVPPHRVKVEVENGWVTMSGIVDRPYQRECAKSAPGTLSLIGLCAQWRVDSGSIFGAKLEEC